MLFVFLLLLYLAIAILVARALLRNDILPRKKPSQYPEILDGYKHQNFSFCNKNNKILKGRYIKAANNPSNKTLLLLHERLGSRLTIIDQTKFFVDAGYHVLTYDQRSHGDSDNDLITYGAEEGEDLSCALAFFKTLPDINREQFFAIGFNMGGCAMVCCPDYEQGPVFKAMVLEGIDAHAFDVGNRMIIKKCGPIIGHLIARIFFSVGSFIVSRGRFYHEKMLRNILRLSHTPKLFIQGEKDPLVTADNAQKIYKTSPNPKQLRKSEGAGHTDSFMVNSEKYKQKVLTFLEENTGEAQVD